MPGTRSHSFTRRHDIFILSSTPMRQVALPNIRGPEIYGMTEKEYWLNFFIFVKNRQTISMGISVYYIRLFSLKRGFSKISASLKTKTTLSSYFVQKCILMYFFACVFDIFMLQ